MKLGGKHSIWLRPFAYLYGLGVGLRNFCFDRGILPSESYSIPIICVGNITVGGTGKTPHVEKILSLLSLHYRIAVLSRGYKRRTRGLVVASEASTVEEIGDEPRQIKLKFPEVAVVVDANRRRAMRHLLNLPEDERPQIVVMDDGFQHRYIKPSFSILLMDAGRELSDDRLLPEGTLREPASARYRADCVIVSKCPKGMSPLSQRLLERNLSLYPHQSIFFSRICYPALRSVRVLLGKVEGGASGQSGDELELPQGSSVIVLSGIANPAPFVSEMKRRYSVVGELLFPDHHNFSRQDLQTIYDRQQESCLRLGREVSIVCTEKDAVRLVDYRGMIADELFDALYYQPIEMEVVDKAEEFARLIQLSARAKPTPLQKYFK